MLHVPYIVSSEQLQHDIP